MTDDAGRRRLAQDGAERSGAPEGLTLIAAAVVAIIFWRDLWGGVTWWWRTIREFVGWEFEFPYGVGGVLIFGGIVITFVIGITLAAIVIMFALTLIARSLRFTGDLFTAGRRGWKAGTGSGSGDSSA